MSTSAPEVVNLSNSRGFSVSTLSTGASVVDIKLPNNNHVVLGYANLTDYACNPLYIGCTVGRCTNRTANAKFVIDGEEYQISANVPPNHLHGGAVGFNKYNWKVDSVSKMSVTYSMTSPDLDQGYPGNISVLASYTVTEDDELCIQYSATTDKPTPVNLTNHTYFNLAGKGNINEHMLTLNADKFTPVDDQHIPTGEVKSVEGTPLDFCTPHSIGERYREVSAVGYDNNYCLNSLPAYDKDASLHFSAKLVDPSSGNCLKVYTDQPCIQLYQGGYLDGKWIGLDGKPMEQYTGLCLETQKHPDAINQPNFPSTLLLPGNTYTSRTVWKFEY